MCKESPIVPMSYKEIAQNIQKIVSDITRDGVLINTYTQNAPKAVQ